MSEYIDKQALLSFMRDNEPMNYEWAYRIVHGFPAADVEPVVRCKDCEYGGKIDSIFQTWCKKDMRRVNNDFYCAHGKERER